MAKSPRIGENRGRRAADKRRSAEDKVAAEPMPAKSKDRSVSTTTIRPAGAYGVTKQQIAARAYELFVARGGTHGYDIEDWLQAERDLIGS